MTVHDRLRATTEAISGAMTEVRPLTLPPERPGRVRPPREPRRWAGWAVPLTAAAAVVALAATLVAVRTVHSAAPASPAPAVNSGVAADGAIPAYYVQLGAFKRGAAGHPDAIVGDDRTGRALATVKAPAGLVFDGVTGNAEDRTFVLDAVSATTIFASATPPAGRHTWFLLQLAPGRPDPVTLTKLPITSVLDSDQIDGLALSPDAGTLAVLYATDVSLHSTGPARLQTFSLSTGRTLRTWTAPAPGGPSAISTPPSDGGGLTWSPDGATLAFMWYGPAWHSALRLLNVDGKSSGLLAGSRAVFSNQGDQDDCFTVLLAPSGRTLYCGTVGNALAGCRAQEPQFKAYSALTGRLDRVLYTYPGNCQGAVISPQWALSDDTMIGVLLITDDAKSGAGLNTWTAGVFSPGKFTPLRLTETAGDAPDLGDLAF